jgi:hypothetical protein
MQLEKVMAGIYGGDTGRMILCPQDEMKDKIRNRIRNRVRGKFLPPTPVERVED